MNMRTERHRADPFSSENKAIAPSAAQTCSPVGYQPLLPDRRLSDDQVHCCWLPTLRTDSGAISSVLPRDPRALGRSDPRSAAIYSELRTTGRAPASALGRRGGILVR